MPAPRTGFRYLDAVLEREVAVPGTEAYRTAVRIVGVRWWVLQRLENEVRHRERRDRRDNLG